MNRMQGEVVLNISAKKAWSMFTDNEIIRKINPDMLAAVEYIRGDGSPGSLRLFKLGPAVHDYVRESVQKIEKVEKGKSVTYRVVQGELRDMYDPYIVTFSFVPYPGNEEKKCTAKWKAEYAPILPSTPPPDQAKDAALSFLECFDKF